MKKALAILCASVLLFAACGREGDEEAEILGASGSASPTATDDAEKSAKPGEPTAAAADATTAPGEQPSKTSAPAAPKPAPQGQLNQPKAGDYIYTLKGKASDPFNPAAGEQDYSGELEVEISHSGNITTREQTSSNEAGRQTVRTRRESNRILLLSFKQETPQGDFSCEFNPAPEIAHIPVKVEKFPSQDLKGKGNACGGKLDIDVQRMEPAKDAAGKSWSTWRVLVHQTTETDQFKIDNTETRWISPDLGVEIRTDGKSDGEIKAGATSQKFTRTAATALKERP